MRPCGTWMTPLRTMASGEAPARSTAPNAMRPPRTGLSPEIARRSAVLPAPLGPSTPTIELSGTLSATPRSTSSAS